jgi:hypothetical protein
MKSRPGISSSRKLKMREGGEGQGEVKVRV